VAEGTRLENEKYTFAHFLTRLKGSSLLTFSDSDFLDNHQESAQKPQTVSNGSIRFSLREISLGAKTFGLTRFTVTPKDFTPTR
jgi:hypothetical protein